MAIRVGDIDSGGMTKYVNDEVDAIMEYSIEDAMWSQKPEDFSDEEWHAKINQAIEKSRPNWQTLNQGLAKGIVTYVLRDQPNGEQLEWPDEKTEYVETYSSSEEDETFWTWLQGFVGEFINWVPTTPDGQNLKNALVSYLNTNPVPTQLRGIIK